MHSPRLLDLPLYYLDKCMPCSAVPVDQFALNYIKNYYLYVCNFKTFIQSYYMNYGEEFVSVLELNDDDLD